MDMTGNRKNVHQQLQEWKRSELPKLISKVGSKNLKRKNQFSAGNADITNLPKVNEYQNISYDLDDVSECEIGEESDSSSNTSNNSQKTKKKKSCSSSSMSMSSSSSSSSSSVSSIKSKVTLSITDDKITHNDKNKLLLSDNDLTNLGLVQSERIAVNVGGTLFETSKFSLKKISTSLLARFISETQPINGQYFLDRDPSTFKYVLNYLRTDSFDIRTLPNDTRILYELFYEAKYYQLPDFMKAIATKIEQVNVFV
jgi:hypothetical protein